MKFRITESNGKTFIVNRRDSEEKLPRFKEESIKEPAACKDDAEKVFTDEEVQMLKKLLEKADAILDLLKGKDADKEDKEEDEEEDIDEEDDMQELAPDDSKDEDLLELPDEEDEETKDSCGTKSTHDSKRSYGAIESRDSVEDDSIDIDNEIAQAWAKRYGGNK